MNQKERRKRTKKKNLKRKKKCFKDRSKWNGKKWKRENQLIIKNERKNTNGKNSNDKQVRKR